MGSLLTIVLEIIAVIGLMISAWATSAAVSSNNIQRAYFYGGITAVLGIAEVTLAIINCVL